jgi:ABC-type lipoprotein export system ATPase subunit
VSLEPDDDIGRHRTSDAVSSQFSLRVQKEFCFAGFSASLPARIFAMLAVADLRKSFVSPEGERVEIVNVPGFTIAAGEQIALRGESGSGKTTFLNLIAGILAADSGRVTIDGTEMTALSEPKRDRLRAEKLGYIFQTFNLLQGYTVMENVLLGMTFGPRGANRAHAREMLERVGLGHRLSHFPSQLSTGQQQRVAVARALVNHPKLVLADEPTGNLDHKHAHEALALIRDVCREQNAALLLVSHDEEVLGMFSTRRNFTEINTKPETGDRKPESPNRAQ